MKRFILSLPEALNTAIRAAAARRGEPVAVWVRDACREKLEREQP